MKAQQAKQLAQRLCELFPGQLKPAEKSIAINRFAAFPFELVDRQIIDRWQEFKKDPAKRLKLDELLDACQSEIDHAIAASKAGADSSWCATQRRNNKTLRGEKSNHALILRVFGAFWDRCNHSDSYRMSIRRDCMRHLMNEAGLSEVEAAADADLVVTDVPTLKARLSELRGELPVCSSAP